jgi:naphthalene 1,2-dioxygenase system ferredoxin subunit
MSDHNKSWVDVAALDDVWDGAGMPVQTQGKEIALFRLGEAVYATDNLCTHGHAALCDGFIEGHQIECPLHQGRFDLRTGAATCEPAVDALKVYPVKIEGGRVYLMVD